MIKTYLEPAEINAMMNNARCDRDRLIIAFLKDTGVRVSELLSIRVKNIDTESGTALIPHLKRGIKKKCPACSHTAGRTTQFCSRCGFDLSKVEAEGIEDRGRLICIGPELVDLLREYTFEMSSEEPLVNVSRQHVHTTVRALAESIGLKGKCILNPETRQKHYVHPHSFRDSLAAGWLDASGEDVGMQKALQEHLGHKSFETSMRYHKLTQSTVRAAADKVREIRFGNKGDAK